MRPHDDSNTTLAEENERLRSELDTLRSLEERFRTTLYAIGDGVIATDADGRVVQMNNVAESLTGWLESEALGQPAAQVFRIFNEHTRAPVQSPIERVLKEGCVVGLANHTVLIARDGSEYPIADSGAPIRNPLGEITGVVLVFRDQTSERNAEAAKRNAEERLSCLFDTAPDFIYCMSLPNGRYEYVSPAASRLFGYTPDEFIENPLLIEEIIHPDWRNYFENEWRRLLAGQTTPIYEYQIVHKNGETRWINQRNVVMRDENGTPNALWGIVTDTSQSKRAQERIAHLNCVLKAIRNISRIIAIETDPEKLIAQACDLLVETRGYNGAWIGLGDAQTPSGIYSESGWTDAFEPLAENLRDGQWPACAASAIDAESCHMIDSPHATCTDCPLAFVYHDNHSVVTPLRHDSSIFGFLSVSFPAEMCVDEDERDLLIEVAQDIAFALHKMDMEREKKESESRLAAAVQGGNVGLWDWDLLTDRVTLSNEWKAQIGYAPDEIEDTYNEWVQRVHPDDLSSVLGRIEQSLKNSAHPYHTEFRFRHKDGSYRWILAHALVARDHRGRAVRMHGAHIDVTELRTQKELHDRAQRVAHLGHWELNDIDGTPIWSDEIYRMFGLTPHSAPPSFTNHNTIIHPDDWPLLQEAMRAGFQDAERFNLVFRLLKKDGHIGWMRAVGEPQLDDTGNTIKMFGTAQDVTALLSAERLLAKAQALGAIGSWHLNIQKNRLFWTEENCRIFGVPTGTVATYEFFLEVVHPEDRQYVSEKWDAALAGAPYDIEHRILVNKEIRWVREKAEIERDSMGRALKATGFTQDITDLKKAIERLTASERRFRNLFENSLAPILIADGGGRYIDVNPAAAEMFQIERNRLLGMRVADLISPTISAGRQFEDYRRTPNSQGEFVFIRGDGEKRRALWSASEIAPGEYASVLQDITPIVQYQQRLQQEKERAQQYLDVAAVILVGLDTDGKICLLNFRGCEVLGFADEQSAIGQEWFQFIPESERKRVKDTFQAIIRGKNIEFSRVEGHIQTISGEIRTVVWHNAVVPDDTGRIVGTLSSGEDATERKQLETQLAQADRLSSMGMLAAGVAHEINNPLSYVLYNLESLEEELPSFLNALRRFQWRMSKELGPSLVEDLMGPDAERINPAILDDIQRHVKDALVGTHRIREVSRGLSTFSRVEKDQLAPVDLMQVIEVALNMAFNEVKYRARLVKDYSRNLPPVLGSEGRLGQVFLNLVINATHAIDDGDYDNNEIRVKTWLEGDTVIAQVKDTGHGISKENLNRIFEPFFTTKKIGVGSGLGLAISKDIVEGYGGSIQVDSEVGVGTLFTVRLPTMTNDTVTVDGHSTESSEKFAKGRILIVDDEDGIRTAMAHMLHQHDTEQAATGAEAKLILEQDQQFDLILCDMMMPDVSGMDLHKWLAAEHPALAEHLVFVTGGAFTPNAREYLSQVDNVRLEKPFDTESFRRIVNDAIIAGNTDIPSDSERNDRV